MKIFYIYKKYVPLLIAANILLQVSAFALVKVAAIRTDGFIDMFLNIFYLIAISLVLIRSVVWQLILKERDISDVYPLNSVVPVLILLSGFVFFNEPISFNNLLGTLVLMIGIFIIADGR